jgi:outer membrane protein OmpA-like peptidoglycan-associated protein
MNALRTLPFLLPLALSLSASVAVLAEPVETEIPGVTAELVELRQAEGVLRLAVRFKNDSGKNATGQMINFSQVALVNAKSKQKSFVVKGADGRYLAGPTGDWGGGGRWSAAIPAKSETILWALFEPVAPGSVLSVQIPSLFPFDDVAVKEGPGTLLSSKQAVSETRGLQAALFSAKRKDQQLIVRLRITAGSAGASDTSAIYFEDVYFLDAQGKRKYPLLKDAEGKYVASPVTDGDHGGRFWPTSMSPNGTALMSLTFAAPPDSVVKGDVVIHGFLPLEGVAIEGEGGAAQGGIAAAGKSVGLESALKELQAEVAPEEIKINLSADVLFDFDKSDLKPAAERSLQNLLTVVLGKPGTKVLVEGHTDVRGEAAYNQALSKRRADAVKRWLVAQGTDGARITASGAGKSRPLRAGNTEEDHKANRRVEIRIRN